MHVMEGAARGVSELEERRHVRLHRVGRGIPGRNMLDVSIIVATCLGALYRLHHVMSGVVSLVEIFLTCQLLLPRVVSLVDLTHA